ncbi:unnamed protein product [Calypogeia fissa]
MARDRGVHELRNGLEADSEEEESSGMVAQGMGVCSEVMEGYSIQWGDGRWEVNNEEKGLQTEDGRERKEETVHD